MEPLIPGFAPAKINLTLHVTGQRVDGYHLLDSLVMFADVGDQLGYKPGGPLTLSVKGPRSEGVPTDHSNLIHKAVLAMGVEDGFVELTKNLPAASGIGGGSADAAAMIRLLEDHFDKLRPSSPEKLGADIPACLMSQTLRMQGVGEVLTPLPGLPTLWAVLVNPGVEVPTPVVFAGLTKKENAPHEETIPSFGDTAQLVTWLADQRNDLQDPAIRSQPVIADVLKEITDQPGCQLARMSGSGATCFGLFADHGSALAAAHALQHEHPNWWVVQTLLGDALN